MSKYIGVVKDCLKTMETQKTNSYDTYKEAHDAAERLCKRTMGERGTIDIEYALTQDENFIYVGGGTTNKVFKVNKTDLSKVEVGRYYIDYGTGAGNEWVTGTLEEAKRVAAEGVSYTRTDAVILEDGEEVARLVWCGCPPDDDDIEVVADFGDFGFYYWA